MGAMQTDMEPAEMYVGIYVLSFIMIRALESEHPEEVSCYVGRTFDLENHNQAAADLIGNRMNLVMLNLNITEQWSNENIMRHITDWAKRILAVHFKGLRLNTG